MNLLTKTSFKIKATIIAGILGIFISLPIWYYLLYVILDAINADSLTWFLYWVYVPISVLISIVAKIVGE